MTPISKFDSLVNSLASDLKEAVVSIESSLATTQNHYGRYMSIIGIMAKGDKRIANILALALIKAGANRHGVKSALSLSI